MSAAVKYPTWCRAFDGPCNCAGDDCARELDADLAVLANDSLCLACKVNETPSADDFMCAECRAERGQ
jgi:hypothetical protein